jgi:hypothetical protein
MDGEGREESWRRELCDRLSFSLGSPKSGVDHGIADCFPVKHPHCCYICIFGYFSAWELYKAS